jgi:hypothetical protein
MPMYEITQKFVVVADDAFEARRRVFPAVGKRYLIDEKVRELPPKPAAKSQGWGEILKQQLVGKRSRR